MPRWAPATVLLISLAAGGCAYQHPHIANPSGLPSDALTLQMALDRGCLPYMLGEKTETAAMGGLGLSHHRPGLSLTPPGPPFWLGGYPGLSNVVVGRDSCSINMRGGDIAAFRSATQAVLRRRFGPAVEQDAQSGYAQNLPGQITACHNGLRYTYYPHRGLFSVDLYRVADCARDPMLPTR